MKQNIKVYTDSYESGVPSAVGLGNFDGIHLGHGALLDKLVQKAGEAGIPSVLYTFENHPNKILFKDRETLLIMTREQKIRIAQEKKVDSIYLEKFDEAYAMLTPEEFVKQILVDKLNIRIAVVGYDYSFGYKGMGKCADLVQMGKTYGFKVYIVPPVKMDNVVISSTLLRQKIKEGDMDCFKRYTGRYYSIPGTVIVGRKVGRQLGFPTANILPREGFALPAFGVYATTTVINGVGYKSITNVGDNPTFDRENNRVMIETHILDYCDRLYGDDIEVFFITRMRDECKFETVEALQKQLAYDKKRREDYPL